MNAPDILHKYLDAHKGLYEIVYDHSKKVADKAVSIALKHPELHSDLTFLKEASMLHDIGVFKTYAPNVRCFGTLPYLCHGYLGREILDAEGLTMHALVCERHVGTGLTLDEIVDRDLPLPHRDMIPLSINEQIICFSDLFFSKSKPEMERTPKEVRCSLEKYGSRGLDRFDAWCKLFL
jgi:uncharacterized protein